MIVVIANGTKMVVTKMNAATFSCKNCKIKFQLIGIYLPEPIQCIVHIMAPGRLNQLI